MANQTAGVDSSRASAKLHPLRILAASATIAILAGCASSYRAPIVHRSPMIRTQPPVATAPAPAAPSAASPSVPGATAPADHAPANGAAVQTVPIPRGTVESRPLPGPGGAIATAPSGAASNLLKTEPKALKQPYSDAALAQMKSAASASDAPPPVALAPPSAPPLATAPTPKTPEAAAASDADGYIWPASGQVLQDSSQPRSMGISIAGKPGDPIVAVSDGRVIFSGAGPRPYGNLVIVKHANETLSVYAHNRTLLVKEGQSVKRGQRIAELGNSGTDAPKLHFEMRDKQGKPVDPRKLLPER